MNTASDERFDDVYEPRSERYAPLRDHLISQVTREITPLVSELENLLSTLPVVKPDGRSDCPFAREMYRQKERLERKVIGCLNTLRDYALEVKREIERCKRNLARIGLDARKVVSEAVKGKYRKAETRQEEEYREVLLTQKELERRIMRADATIAASRRKVFPGGTSGQGSVVRMPATATTDAPGGGSGVSTRDQVEGLLALGDI